MPRYIVTSTGFYGGKLYSPNGRRRILSTDKPFTDKTKPSWIGEQIQEETAAQRKAREKREASEAQKRKEDKKDIDAVTFVEDPAPSGPAVETL